MPDLELWSYTFRKTNLVELAAAAAAAGFACVTTTPQLFTRSGGDTADLRTRVEDLGMRVTFVDGLCTALPGTDLPPGEPTIDDCIHIAHATGAGAINVVHMTGRPMPLAEMADAAHYFYAVPHPGPELLAQQINAANRPALFELQEEFAALAWQREAIGAALKAAAARHTLKPAQVMMPLRALVAGTPSTPAIDAVLALLGRETARSRIASGLNL